MLLTEGFLGWGFFWVCRATSIKSKTLNVHTFNHRHRTDRRVKGLVAEGWAGGEGLRYGRIGGRKDGYKGGVWV
jgi:hypothetical protein